jgi:hypothetical protein
MRDFRRDVGPRRLAAPDERCVSALRAGEYAREQRRGGGTDVAAVWAGDSSVHETPFP